MSLNKAVEYGKEHRKPYRGAKAFDSFCRNHGECAYCTGNRLYQLRKNEEKCKLEMSNGFRNAVRKDPASASTRQDAKTNPKMRFLE